MFSHGCVKPLGFKGKKSLSAFRVQGEPILSALILARMDSSSFRKVPCMHVPEHCGQGHFWSPSPSTHRGTRGETEQAVGSRRPLGKDQTTK